MEQKTKRGARQMMQQTINVMKERIQTRGLYQIVKEVSSFHRIQASGGFRAAANWCCDWLNRQGVQAQVLHYPAPAGGYAGSYRLFQEWNCTAGWCRLAGPEGFVLADYSVEPISLIQKSCACDWRDKTLDLVEMTEGCEKEAYEGWDLEGKVLFTHQHINKFSWAIQKRGALGIVSDYLNETPHVRIPEELLDALNYTSFWWEHTPGERQAFGFVVSPRTSLRLQKLCCERRQAFEKGECESPYLALNAYVEATLENGTSEVVEAVLPGESEESVLVCAHLCHPCASANDNASGVAGAMTLMSAIHAAVEEGQLPPLKKTIRMILVPEFTGTYNYLNDGRDTSLYTAGINLDMIGAKQEDTTGPITVTCLPFAMPSFEGDLATLLLQELKQETNSREDLLLQNVRTDAVPFGLGSDHFILSDPQVGIPSIMLGQWPDKYYHTSADTIERLDMNVLKFSTLLAAVYVYTLCDLHKRDARLILNHQCTRLMARMETITRRAMLAHSDPRELAAQLGALKEFYTEAARRLCEQAGLDPAKPLARLNALLPGRVQWAEEGPVYRRLFGDPLESLEKRMLDEPDKLALVREYDRRYEAEPDKAMQEALCGYYIDGTRSCGRVADQVIAELGGGNREMLLEYQRLLEVCGLLEMVQ